MQNNRSISLKDAPVLLEILRGSGKNAVVECVHHGLIAVVDGFGESVFSYGESETLIFLRSTAKPLQLLPLFKLGIFDDFAALPFRESDIALMMSSHSGQAIHTKRVEELLSLIGLSPSALRCGIHSPQDETTRKELKASGLKPTVLHNTCSGKHVAMLLACLKQGFDISNYEDPMHPLEQQIQKILLEMGDLNEKEIAVGIDGCSLPTWALPLKSAALIYARLAYWQNDLPSDRPSYLKEAFKKMWMSATRFPEYIGGNNRFDTEIMRAGKQQLFSKTGTDGMQALAFLPSREFPKGLGIAVKIADGDPRFTIRPLVLKELLSRLGLWPSDKSLDAFLPPSTNLRGLTTTAARFSF